MQAPALGNVLGKVGGSGARLRGAGVGRVGRMGRAAGPATGAALASRDRRLQWVVGLLVAVAATVPAWLPWLDPRIDLWDVDDGKNHLLRIYHFGWLLERGIWYPRWVPDMFMGFGYPVLNYYAPAFYFLALLLRGLLRLDVWDAFRATGVVAAALGAAGIYAFTVDLWRRPALGVLAALTLLYGPYVFQLNLYKRGDIPEAFGLALLPLLLLALRRLWLATSRGEAAAWFAAAALAGTAEILVHNLTALLAAALAAVWVAYLLVSRPSRVRLLLVLAAGALAAGLTAFFWVPALRETRAVQLEWLGGDGLAYETWMVDPGGETPKHQSPINRQTRTGLIDLHVHYPHQLQAPPKLSVAQVGLGLVAIVSLAAGVVAAGRTSPPAPLSTPVERGSLRRRARGPDSPLRFAVRRGG